MAEDNAGTQAVYTLGEGCPTLPDGRRLSSWPLEVKYLPGHPGGEFYLAEGDARNGQSSFFSAAEVLAPHWRSHLATTETLWLIPLLERLAHGEPVPLEDILAAYQAVNGKPPPRVEWVQ